ncbi:PF03932 family protein CutC [Amyelois transitella]|uniref:PF03932 family protein CutC n=1 Tax=Amyelois transitella TaxID=680683 RepID=UPI00298F8E42|nr:PF03932 family protein CutC [Amyelois transitella]
MLEVCIDSLESAVNAVYGGANEIEICSSLAEGGLTPSAGLVKTIKKAINDYALTNSAHLDSAESCAKKPKVNVMIRCRTGSDFNYTEQEMETMMADIYTFKEIGVDRFVFGSLTVGQEIDEENCLRVVEAASPVPVTFHRAFDVCKEPNKAMEKLIEIKFDRVLTSGQRTSASDDKAIELIKSLVKSYGDKIDVMPGAGVNELNARIFVKLGCKIVHSSCKKVKHLPRVNHHLSMGTSDSEFIYVTDESIVRRTKEAIVL